MKSGAFHPIDSFQAPCSCLFSNQLLYVVLLLALKKGLNLQKWINEDDIFKYVSNMCQIFSNGHISRDEKFYGWCQTFFHECKEKCAQKIRKALDQNKFGSKKISLVFSLNMLFQEEDKFWQQINPLPLAECDYCIPFRLSLSLFPIFLFLHYHHHHCRSFIIIIIIVVISIFFSANTQTLHQRVWGVVLIFGDVQLGWYCLLSFPYNFWLLFIESTYIK